MGVHGLWRLIEPSGKPVPLETLENKVLAVDISIWLHQAVKGFQDSKGAAVPNAHLLGIYHRVCKLLYFRIKPIFVFDGGVPALKKQTIAKRTQSKLRNVAQADKIQRQLLNTLLKHTAVSKVLTEKIEASIGTVTKVSTKQTKDDLYVLPPTGEMDSTFSSSEDESQTEYTTDSSPSKNWDLHTIDMDSVHFKSLPVDVRHEILTDLKETRKQSSWGRLHELPKVSDDFSVYQLNRLRKRQAVQTALEEAEKEMGGKSLSLAELESILKDQGVLKNQQLGTRIASDETTKYLLVKDVKRAMEEAKKNESESKQETLKSSKNSLSDGGKEEESGEKTKADLEYEEDLEKAIALSLECEPSTSKTSVASSTTKATTNPAEFSFLENFTDRDFVSSSSDDEPLAVKVRRNKMSSAESYMLEFSGLTPSEIGRIINEADSKRLKPKKQVISVISENIVGIKGGQFAALDTVKEHEDEVEMISSNTLKVAEYKGLIANAKASDLKKEDLQILFENKEVKGRELNAPDTKVKEDACKEHHNNFVEIMSSAGSSDSEIEEKIDTKQGLDIVIDPNQHFEDDDLFSDVFQAAGGEPSSVETSEGSRISASVSQKAINIVINPNKEVGKDDLFSSIFGVDHSKGQLNEHKNGKEGGVLERDENAIGHGTEMKSDDTESQRSSHDVAASEDIQDSKDMEGRDDNQLINKHDSMNNMTVTQVTVTDEVVESRKNEIGYSGRLDISKLQKAEKKSMTQQELVNLKNELQKEKVDLLNEKSSKERIAGNITDQMYQEAQELLELFGVPYIIAPMEAEAQCAFLDEIDLTDGTITDDSDIWLFGGKTVYKNFFNQSKHVMEFRADSIEHHFKLTREQMILLALLVGSDYTSGLQGVGPVTAVEILAAFPASRGQLNEFSLSHADLLSGLKEFRSWFSKGKSAGPGRNALKSKLKNLNFTENFPSLQVVEAYLEPKVETSREAFSWSKPNALALIEFAREKFGWTRNKTEDILNPVIKRLEESRHQKSIRDYFKTRFKHHSGVAESKMSKRVKSAITNMGRDPSEIIAEELEEELKKEPKKKRAPRKKKDGVQAPEFGTKETNSDQKGDDGASQNDFAESTKAKVNLRKLKPKITNKDDHQSKPCTTTSPTTKTEESKSEDVEEDISEKIDLIRKRRKLKEAKAAVDIKKPKMQKEKTKTAFSSQFEEVIPESLQADDEVNLLSQTAIQSGLKVVEINKSLQDQLDNLTSKSIQIPKPSTFRQIPSGSQPIPTVRRPVSRPTRVPRKETIPQKEKDKSAQLRNKLKAIEVFRKGKHGPGYVPKKDRKKRLPKNEAQLSESSDE